MTMKLVKTATALALGASLISTAVVSTDASAASKYKISKGKLVIAKTGKVAKGFVTYKSLVYKDGKKLTGLKGKTYYKAGKKATGTYKGAYYYKGAKKVTTGTYKGAYYVKGVKKVTTGLYNNRYYKSGVKATGTYKGAYYVKGVKKVTTGTYNGAYYVKGFKKVTTGFYNDVLYIKGKENKELAIYKDSLFNGSTLNEDVVVFEEKLFDGHKLNKGYKLYKEDLYNNENLNTGKVVFEGKLFDGAKLSKGLVPFTEEGKKELVYNDGELANGTFEVEGKEVAYENGIEVAAKVASVKVVNGTTIEVKFNKAVDKEAAEKAAVTLVGNVLTGNKLSEDGRTLTVKSANAIVADAATLEVPAIATKADLKVSTPKYVQVLSFKDTVAPTVASATSAIATIDATTANTVTVKFSEEVLTAGAIAYVNGEAATVTQGANKDELTLAFTKAAKAGEVLNISLTNVKDIAGNTIDPNPATVSTTVQAADAVAPVVTNVVTDGLKVTVSFNKEVSEQVLTDATYLSAKGVQVGKLSTPVLSEDKKSISYTVVLNADEKAAFDKDKTFSATLYVQEGLVTDAAKNKSAAFNQSVKFDADVTAPTLVSSEYKEDKLVLVYDEDVVLGTDAKLAYTSKNASTGFVGTTEYINLDSKMIKGKEVTIDLKGLTAEKTFDLAIAKGAFKDAANNEVVAFAKTITTPKAAVEEKEDKVAPKVTLAQGNAADYSLTFTVTDELNNLDFASILDVNNYQFAGKALPAGTVVKTNATEAAKTAVVTVTLPKTAFAADAEGIFTITGIKDIKGNAVTDVITTEKVTFKDAVAPELKTAKINADGSISLALSEEVTKFNDKNFVVKVADKAVEGTLTQVKAGADKGTVLFVPTTAKEVLDATKVIVETVNDATESAVQTQDAAGNVITLETKITATK
ncbi:hypothetical protein [Kurthia zopfii]|uniref:hypothetical protein n=1 Tax=Kurthia zopfii TaxID=1650 RepID=UPI000F720061|nr:hypothetical protein [Kurthia zopfii]VEI05018.1 Uncharacterised protein [Kurthia zopfii]